MKHFHSFPIALLVLLSVISGCVTKEEIITPPEVSGSITGSVVLIDPSGIRLKDFSGVNIALEGTSFSTISDSTGRWRIDGVSTGIYTITYSKSGFGTYKTMYQGFIGDTLHINNITLTQPPNFTVSLDPEHTHSDTNSIYISGLAKGCGGTGFSRVLVALGTTPDVSAADAGKYQYTTSTIVWANSLYIGMHIYQSDLYYSGLVKGSTVYAVIYPLSSSVGYSYTSYLDQNTGKNVYTSLGTPSAVVAVKVP